MGNFLLSKSLFYDKTKRITQKLFKQLVLSLKECLVECATFCIKRYCSEHPHKSVIVLSVIYLIFLLEDDIT